MSVCDDEDVEDCEATVRLKVEAVKSHGEAETAQPHWGQQLQDWEKIQKEGRQSRTSSAMLATSHQTCPQDDRHHGGFHFSAEISSFTARELHLLVSARR
jgi:hypothetical protein